jgi:hypothetical protein
MKDAGGLVILEELRAALATIPHLSKSLNDLLGLIDDGPTFFRMEIDEAATERTGDLVALYYPSDDLIRLLAAVRAGHREFAEVSLVGGHVLFSPCSIDEQKQKLALLR